MLTPEQQTTQAKPETTPVTEIEQMPIETATVSKVDPAELQAPEIQLADINIASLQPTLSETPMLPQETKQIVEPKKLQKIEPVKPAVKPSPQAKKKPIKKKKRAEKKKPRKKKSASNSGSGGKSKRNARLGTSDGSKNASRNAGKSSGKKSRKAGNASISNYKGKVRRKVRRSFKRPRKGKRLRADAIVRFVLSRSGSVRSVRLVRSSGSKKLDKAALSAVRRASPFPKPPGNLGGSGLDFTIPFGA